MDLLDLPWLPPAPADFRDAVRALRREQVVSLGSLRQLASHRLDLSQLTLLERACLEASAADADNALQLRLLSNANQELSITAITATAPRHGLLLKVSTGPFGTWMQEALDPRSETARDRPQFVLLALDWRAFDLEPCPGEPALAEQRVSIAVDQLLAAAQALIRNCGCQVLVQTLVEPAISLFGSMDVQVPGTLRWLVQRFNQRLVGLSIPGLLLVDIASIAAQVGEARWHDPALWHLGKFPMATRALALYADHVCRVLMACRGLARKCLVLDLDNTLWSGVIGDDGLGGIVVGQGSAVGEAHLAVQACALALRDRGVILAVSSKNDEAIARQALREHPDMLLREHHLAAFFVNWQDKASNLRAIAATLNIGTDALVLLDDNPSERHQVRNALPEVGVPELPASPEHYPAILQAAGYFESVQFTDDDRRRAEQYQQNAARSAALVVGSDLASHLASLDMHADFAPFDAVGRARITQLINKTNQFNLTTRRRTEAEVVELERDRCAITLQVRLKDRFGDNGMISVVVGKQAGDELEIDTWLMSCRVLDRGIERAVLNELVAKAAARGVRRITGWYRPTAKNALVRDHYASLGFVNLSRQTGPHGDATHWALDVDSFAPLACHVHVSASSTPAELDSRVRGVGPDTTVGR
jgi:FkbH-like protein